RRAVVRAAGTLRGEVVIRLVEVRVLVAGVWNPRARPVGDLHVAHVALVLTRGSRKIVIVEVVILRHVLPAIRVIDDIRAVVVYAREVTGSQIVLDLGRESAYAHPESIQGLGE